VVLTAQVGRKLGLQHNNVEGMYDNDMCKAVLGAMRIKWVGAVSCLF
jgi:hypothetical protein